MTVCELRGRRDSLQADAKRILTKAEGEGRDLTDLEKRQFDLLVAEKDQVQRDLESALTAGTSSDSTKHSWAYEARGESKPRRSDGITCFRSAKRDEPTYGFRASADIVGFLTQDMSCRSAIECLSQPGSFGRYAAYRATNDERYLCKDERSALAEFRDQSGASNTLGAYLDSDVFYTGLFISQLSPRMRVMQAGAMVIPLTGSHTIIAKHDSGPTFVTHGENVQESVSNITFSAVTLTPRTTLGLCRVSDELAADAFDFWNRFEQVMAEKMAIELDRLALAGTGSQEHKGLIHLAGNTESVGGVVSQQNFANAILECWNDNAEVNAIILRPGHRMAIDSALKNSEANNWADRHPALTDLPQYQTTSLPTGYALVGNFREVIWGLRHAASFKLEREVDRNSALISITARSDFNVTDPNNLCVLTGIT